MKNDPRNTQELLEFCENLKKQDRTAKLKTVGYLYKYGWLEYYFYRIICDIMNIYYNRYNKTMCWVTYPNFDWIVHDKT